MYVCKDKRVYVCLYEDTKEGEDFMGFYLFLLNSILFLNLASVVMRADEAAVAAVAELRTWISEHRTCIIFLMLPFRRLLFVVLAFHITLSFYYYLLWHTQSIFITFSKAKKVDGKF